MLHPKCFSQGWIVQKAAELRCQPLLLEKAIVALQLLGHLGESGLQFQFKGGTSLLLRLPVIRRLSIDIDIITQAEPNAVLEILTRASTATPFFHFGHDVARDRELPPSKHFNFLYQSVIEKRRDSVLLDVLFEKQVTPHTEPVFIKTPFIETIRDVQVAVPTINSLLGDKLTAIAPTTIGILYKPERKMDIIKQLFDVGSLFDVAGDFTITADVYAAVHARQCVYREKAYTLAQTLDDSIEAAMQLSAHGLNGFEITDKSQLLRTGVDSLQNHLVNHSFGHDQARIAAGKVACLAAWIKHRPQNLPIETLRFNNDRIPELGEKSIGPPWAPLHRLKRINPEAFHYWWHAGNLNAK